MKSSPSGYMVYGCGYMLCHPVPCGYMICYSKILFGRQITSGRRKGGQFPGNIHNTSGGSKGGAIPLEHIKRIMF